MTFKYFIIGALVLTFAFPCFAANRLKYKIADGEVVTMGALPELEAGAGERVVSVDFEVPKLPLSYFTFDGEKLVKKSQPVIDAEEAKENVKARDLMGCLCKDMPPESLLKLAPYGYALQSFIDWKNWEGIKLFIGALEQSGIATADEAAIVTGCFAKQNVEIK